MLADEEKNHDGRYHQGQYEKQIDTEQKLVKPIAFFIQHLLGSYVGIEVQGSGLLKRPGDA
jgi:hypothetical protein